MRRLILTCILLAAPTLAQAQTSQTCAPVTEQQDCGHGYPATPERHGSLPSRPVPLPEDPDDEVDVPPFMRR